MGNAQVIDDNDPFANLDQGEDELARELAQKLAHRSKKNLPEVVKERFRQMEDHLMVESLTVLEDVLKFRDVDPNDKDPKPPEDWDALEPKERAKRLRLALAGWESKKTAPVGLALAAQVYVGLAKARATEKAGAGPKTLNVLQVTLSAPLPQYEKIVVARDER